MPKWDDEESQRDLRRAIADQGRKVVDVRLEPPFYHVVTEPSDEVANSGDLPRSASDQTVTPDPVTSRADSRVPAPGSEDAGAGSPTIRPGTRGLSDSVHLSAPAGSGAAPSSGLSGATGELDGRGTVTHPAPVRPFEALLRDPLTDVARKERRSLLGISAIAIFIGHTSLIPQKIDSLGITFTVSTQATILYVFTGVVVYYLLAFVVYAAGDALTLFREIHRREAEVTARRSRPPTEPQDSGSLNLEPAGVAYRKGNDLETGEDVIQAADDSWRAGRLVPTTAKARWFFDYVVPIPIAGYGIWCLVVAAPPAPGGSQPLQDLVTLPSATRSATFEVAVRSSERRKSAGYATVMRGWSNPLPSSHSAAAMPRPG
jgi:hypothetical protein